MILLPLAILLYIPFVYASLPNLNCTSSHTLDVSDSSFSCDTRSLLDIIWSCAATLFACTWTAIHPNIPGMKEGKVAITARRLSIMVAALIAPELMITWAARQFFSARAAAKEFNEAFGEQLAQAHSDHDISESTATLLSEILASNGSMSASKPAGFGGWTVSHGFFAWMGGFILYVNGKPRATLTPYELLEFVRQGHVDMPAITEVEIEDKSKGDVLSKSIAILQLAWFIIQFVARYVQNLPITLLEIDTLALAALTCIAYALWWKKPKDVWYPCIVHWKATGSPSRLVYDKANILSSDGCCLRFFKFLIYPLSSLSGTRVFISPHDVHSRRVPSLGGYGNLYHGKIVLLIGSFSGMVFGGIHCLGWDFLFQRYADQILWRAASIAMACIAVIFLLESGYVIWLERVEDVQNTLLVSATIISSFIYISARVTLVVLIMLSLLSLPSGVYDTVAWTKFIPHL
ncbi:hypothetical protein DFH29DRAFT_992211 [Suillus ampliporus]|nr:hypothetical protein DFH29DRAFT_992211 [Suillus ampliporus]